MAEQTVAEIQLLYGKSSGKSIGGINIDAFIEEGHEATAEPTSYPVEDGTNITDHIVQNPDRLSITGAVGPNSIYTAGTENTQENVNVNRVYDCYLKLLNLKEKGEPVSVVTGLKVYDNMAITAFTVRRTAENGRSLEFTMDLSKTKIIKSQITPITNIGGSNQVKKQAQPTKSMGKTQGSPVTDASKKTSFLDPIRTQVKGMWP